MHTPYSFSNIWESKNVNDDGRTEILHIFSWLLIRNLCSNYDWLINVHLHNYHFKVDVSARLPCSLFQGILNISNRNCCGKNKLNFIRRIRRIFARRDELSAVYGFIWMWAFMKIWNLLWNYDLWNWFLINFPCQTSAVALMRLTFNTLLLI